MGRSGFSKEISKSEVKATIGEPIQGRVVASGSIIELHRKRRHFQKPFFSGVEMEPATEVQEMAEIFHALDIINLDSASDRKFKELCQPQGNHLAINIQGFRDALIRKKSIGGSGVGSFHPDNRVESDEEAVTEKIPSFECYSRNIVH